MDQNAYQAAKAAYQQGDWAQAASRLSACKLPGEISGEADHLLGNSLMKLGMFNDAASAYKSALNDSAYGKRGALACNCGRALVAAGQADEAIAILDIALKDQTYPTPYKAYMTLGNALSKKGAYQDAGVAFRNAAIDQTNPNPAKSLVKLGECFLEMSRALDAIEAYRTALDFASPTENQNSIYESLGRAYFAANKMPEAVDAFNQAMSDGSYMLTSQGRIAYDAANRALSQTRRGPSETDQMLAAAGYSDQGRPATDNYDPLDPLGESGELMPSADDTGFFSVTEEDLIQANQQVDKKKKKKGGFAKFFITLLVILAILTALGGYAYYKGYGWPTQQSIVEDVFQAKTDNADIGGYLAPNVGAEMRKKIESSIPSGATVVIDGVDQDTTSTTVRATATLSQGGKQTYEFKMIRDKISWKIVDVEFEYPSQKEAPKSQASEDVDTQDKQEQSASENESQEIEQQAEAGTEE